MGEIDWKVLSDHLFEKSDQLEKEADRLPRGSRQQDTIASIAMILNAFAKGIQKATEARK